MQMKVDVKQSAIKCVERVVKRMEEQLKKEKEEKQEMWVWQEEEWLRRITN